MLKLRNIVFAMAIMQVATAYAAMPMMTEKPKDITVRACAAWAREQDEEAIDMWGIQQTGNSSYELGVHRLTSECLGEPVSDIVGFGSSVGFNDGYCSSHPGAPICSKRAQQ